MTVALEAERNWALPPGAAQGNRAGRQPLRGARDRQPDWRNAYQVATIGDHTFYRVQSLKPRKATDERSIVALAA